MHDTLKINLCILWMLYFDRTDVCKDLVLRKQKHQTSVMCVTIGIS